MAHWRIALLVLVLASGCGRSGEGRSDSELGGLVHAPVVEVPKIDIDRAAESVEELEKALAIRHARAGEWLGVHRFSGTTSLVVTENGDVIEELSDTTAIELASDGVFHAALENSKDYGRDVYFVADTLYLRPRFGKFHKRAPTSPAEPAKIRDEIYGSVRGYFEVLASGAELTDGGATDYAGRPGRKIVIKKAPSPRDRATSAANDLSHREWRNSASVTAVSGEVILDAETGIPLFADIVGTFSFSRDGHRFETKLTATHKFADIGSAIEIEAPADDQTVTTAATLAELSEREKLLKGIAAPARKAPTPQNPTGEAKGEGDK